jgi:hypothetical protein
MAFISAALSVLALAGGIGPQVALGIVVPPTPPHTAPFLDFYPDGVIRLPLPPHLDLSALRTCWTPKLVVSAGMPRTGSTSLAVIAAIWMALADPNLAEGGWIGTLKPDVTTVIQQNKLANRSQIIKTHNIDEWAESAQVILTAHRDPLTEILSSAQEDKSVKKCLLLLKQQHSVYAMGSKCCGGVAYDMDLNLLKESPSLVIKSIGKAVGVCDEVVSTELLDFVVKAYEAADVESSQGTRSGQAWHESYEYALLNQVRDEMTSDPACNAWIERNGAYLP